jgi:hypothetical protein
MLRITELRLPLTTPSPPCVRRCCSAWACNPPQLQGFTVFRRAWDARKKSAIVLSYTVDCGRWPMAWTKPPCWRATPGDTHIRPTPDTTYRSSATRRPTSAPLLAAAARARWWWASAPAASSRR